MKQGARLFATAPVVVLLVALAPSAAQTPQEVAPEMTAAALRQDWRTVADFAAAQPSLSLQERLLAAHAQLALNRSNEALAGFLSFTEEEPLRQWKNWTAKLRSEHPSNPSAYYLYGDALARLRDWPAAMEAFDAGLKLDPQNAMLLHARGVSHAANWQLDRALVDLTMATRSRPDFADAYASLGSTWVQRQSGAVGALRAFNKALELSPDSPVALYSRGGVRMVQGGLESARVDFDRALEIAGPLAPAITAKLADVIESFRRQQEREIELALNRGENPGVFIQRGIEQLQREGPGGPRGALDTLMSAGVRFPEQQQQITQAMSSMAQSNPGMREQIATGLDRRQKLETHIDSLANAMSRVVTAPIGPAYAAAIGVQNAVRAQISSTTRSTSESFSPVFDRRAFDVKYYSDAGQTFSDLGKAVTAYSKFVPDRFAPAPKFGGNALSLTGAAFQDYSAFRAGRLSLENSKTVDQSAKAFGTLAKDMAQARKWAPEFRVAPGAVDIGLAVKSQLARGSFIPNESERTSWGAAVHGLATADFKSRVPLPGLIGTSSRQAWGGRLAVTSVMPEIFNFTASRFDRGFAAPVSIREVEYGLDAFAKGTAYYATFLATVGNATAAGAVADVVGVAAERGRNASQGWAMWGNTWDFFTPDDTRRRRAAVTKEYTSYIALQLARGQYVESFIGHVGQADANRARLDYRVTQQFEEDRQRANLQVMRGGPSSPSNAAISASSLGSQPPPLKGDRVKPSPAQSQEFRNQLQRALGQDIKPGGFRTGSELPFWQDGEWPFKPWYGLAYVISESPTRTENEEKQQ